MAIDAILSGMSTPIFFLITDLNLGGAPLLLRSLALGLRAEGRFAPSIVSLAPPGRVSEMLESDGVPVYSLGARGAWDLPRTVGRWVGLLRRDRPRIVMSVLVHANLVAAMGRAFGPAAVYFQSIHTLQKNPGWHWAVQGLIAGQSDAMIAPDRAILQKIAENGFFSIGITIPNGIDIDRFHLARQSPPFDGKLLPWPPSARVVGYVGRFDPVKRIGLLLEAAAYAIGHNLAIGKDLHIVLVGYGVQEAELRAQVACLGLGERVFFAGPTENPENWYKSFDVMCLPSDAEGFGLTVIEALAAGVRVIAADIAPLRSISHGGLRLVSDCSAASLALVMQEVMDAPAIAKPHANEAFARLRTRYSRETMVAAYSKIFRKFSVS